MITIRTRSLTAFTLGIALTIITVWSLTAWRANAAIGPDESTFVPVTPARILDTRDPNNIGLPGPFVSVIAQDLQVTGNVATSTGPQVVVPPGATGVALNVTVVGATADGFLSIRPADAVGPPQTSNLNFSAGDVTPNAVEVRVPTSGPDAGKIEIIYDAYGVVGPTADVLIDVVGYNTSAGLQALAADVQSLETEVATKADQPIRTVLRYTGGNTVVVNGNFQLIRTIGTFTKQSADTELKLEWNAHHSYPAANDNTQYCHYQLRIDGLTTTGNAGLAYSAEDLGNAVSYSANAPLAVSADFAGIAVGDHEVQVWVRGSAAGTCQLNRGNFAQHLTVEEYTPAPGSTLTPLSLSSTDTDEGAGGM